MSKEKVWLVTGASRGIGLAVAQRVVAAGECVALLARGESVLAAAADRPLSIRFWQPGVAWMWWSITPACTAAASSGGWRLRTGRRC